MDEKVEHFSMPDDGLAAGVERGGGYPAAPGQDPADFVLVSHARCGFHMRPVGAKDGDFSGWHCISERAIDRTWHRKGPLPWRDDFDLPNATVSIIRHAFTDPMVDVYFRAI